ncbi:DNA-binding protein H-NS [Cognatiyoonia koreensis]|uniref:DNA-binding protein H-NS n=1 Tax=Cognatiyoonia koreensis TaxID=364200 RepID=A0A1I0QMQ8_9RHOB|nr:H-NS histone family protein [Cognatiyoonia koreensis]SEW28414.1 DNA-binding protein H-NS [Cognatiyoonia koreensis]
MSIDLSAMSRKELTKLRDNIDKALESLKKKELKAAREAAEKAAAAHGFSLAELTGAGKKYGRKKSSGPKTKAPAKFKNPNDPSQTWTGKGRQPQWFKDAMASGATPDSLAV